MTNTGMSGNFTPFAKLYGKFFTDEDEPQSWDEDFANLYNNYFNGANVPVKALDYYYKKEKKSRKALRNLDNINSFINDNPHIGNKQLFFDLSGKKLKIVKIKDMTKKYVEEDSSKLIRAIKIEEKVKKKTRGRKKKVEIKIKKVKIKRV